MPCIYLELLKEICIDDDDIKRENDWLRIVADHFMMVRARHNNAMDFIKEFDADSTKLTEKERNVQVRIYRQW